MEVVPTVDISSLFGEDKEKKLASCKLVGKALKEVGFMYITNHGIDFTLQKMVLENVKKFFSLPIDKKMEVAQPEGCIRGYLPLGKEQTDDKVDARESVCYLPDFELPLDEGPLSLLGGANPWPRREYLPEFQATLEEYVKQMNELGHTLMSALAVSLGLNEDIFREKFTVTPFTELSVFHYPPSKETVEPNDTEWGVREHTDYGALTLLMQDHVGGLQLKTRDDHWIEAPPLAGSFVVNACDMLELWTNGHCRSGTHRVKAPTKDRYSVGVFFGPSINCEISPLPLTENNDYEKKVLDVEFPVHYGKYIAKKFAKSFSHKYSY